MKRHTAQAEKEFRDKTRLLRAWKKFHREERDAALSGPHRVVLSELFRAFDNLAHIKPVQLIGLLRSINWSAVDHQTRLTVLHELNVAIMKYRERRGAEPIADNLFDEPDTPFRVIRAIIHQVPATRGEASPELIRQISGEVK